MCESMPSSACTLDPISPDLTAPSVPSQVSWPVLGVMLDVVSNAA